MKVEKRDGRSVDVSYDEIKTRVARLMAAPVFSGDDASDGDVPSFDGLDVDSVVIPTVQGIHDGITTSELDGLSARIAASLQSVDHRYDALAGRIAASNLQKNVARRFREPPLGDRDPAGGPSPSTFSARALAIERASPGTYDAAAIAFVARHADALDAAVVPARDLAHTYFAVRTLERSYLQRDASGEIVETPQDMWMRVAVGIHAPADHACDEDHDRLVDATVLLYQHQHPEEKDPTLRPQIARKVRDQLCADEEADALARAVETYDLTSRGLFTHATPTLFNAGLRNAQMSSCYLLGTEDDLGGIFKTVSDCAQISKWAGGIGVHVSNVRARGSRIAGTNGVSDGIVPMLKVYNEVARYCNQAGKRKGSIAAYLEPWHADVWEFVELRRNTGAETERARDLFLALWVPDAFMRAVRDDGPWWLMSPDACPGLCDAWGPDFDALYARYVAEGRFVRRLNGGARELWQHVLTSQLETGVPYVMFKDAVNSKSNQRNVGTIRSSNLCAEVCEYSDSSTYAVCNLASVAVNRFLRPGGDGGGYDHAALHAVAKVVTRNLNRVIDRNFYPTPETRASNAATRPIGIGVQGFGDLYCLLRLRYDSPEALRLDADVLETIYHGALEASVELAEADGPYERFAGSPFSRGELQFDAWARSGQQFRLSGRWDWDALRARVVASGTRNSLLTALMPTASTSQLLGNTESCEPFHSNAYKRTTLAGEFLVVNKHMMRALGERGLWTEGLRRALIRAGGSVQGLPGVPDDLKEVFRTVWEVPQRAVVDHALARGPFVDQSQSTNLFFATPSSSRLSSALLYGWQRGIKTGAYYVRTQPAADGIKYGLSASDGPSAPSCSLGTGKGGGGDDDGDRGCEACGA